MKEVIFVTGNKRKVDDAVSMLKPYNINIEQKKISLDELQSHDPNYIATAKAKNAYKIIKKPLVINDAFWSFPSLNGFPGGYIKDIVQWFGTEDFIALLENKHDRSVIITETITYIDEQGIRSFSHDLIGVIIMNPRGEGNSIETIAEFNGQTLAEYHAKKLDIKPKGNNAWTEFASWYSTY